MNSIGHGANQSLAFSVFDCFVGLQAAIDQDVETVSIGPLFQSWFRQLHSRGMAIQSSIAASCRG